MNSKKILLSLLLFMFFIFLVLALMILYLSADFERNFVVRDIDSYEEYRGERITGRSLINESFELEPGDFTKAISTEGFLEINVTVFQGFVMMRDIENPCDAIVVAIDDIQAHSIYQGLNKQIGFRPTTHDIIYDIIESYDIEVLMTKITDFEEGAYFGSLILRRENKILNLDVRPSDGIAISVRTDSPIYISNDVMEKLKEKVC